jgi:hypothetical protein
LAVSTTIPMRSTGRQEIQVNESIKTGTVGYNEIAMSNTNGM